MTRSHHPRRAPPVRAMLACGALALGLGLLPGGAGAQPAPAGPPTAPGDAWQRQQPTRERTQRLMEQQGVAPSEEERREQLRTLNEIHRQLMPPGTTVPAPGLAPSPSDARTGAN